MRMGRYHSGNVFGGFIIICLGVLFLLNNFGMLDFGDFVSHYWPVILILVGIRFILGFSHRERRWSTTETPFVAGNSFAADSLAESRVLGDLNLKVDSHNFKGGTVSNTIGGTHIDLSAVTLAEGQQELVVTGFIGDIHLIAPKQVPYAIDASVSLGDVILLGRKDDGFGVNRTYQTEDYTAATTRLNIRLSLTIGSVKVY